MPVLQAKQSPPLYWRAGKIVPLAV